MVNWSSLWRSAQPLFTFSTRVLIELPFCQGGYNLDSISNSALAVTKVLLGHAPDDLPPMTASVEGSETVWMVAKQQSKYWKSVDAAACEPRERKAIFFYLASSRFHRAPFLQRLKR